MKLLLISDSHGSSKSIDRIFSNCEFDYLFFLGDGLSDLGTYVNLDNVYYVSGNCDFFSREQGEKYIELEGKKILYTHGNRYGVKSGLGKLIEHAEELDVDFCFYGHTHIQKFEKIGDIYYVNPGSFHKNMAGESKGILLTIENNNVNWDIVIV